MPLNVNFFATVTGGEPPYDYFWNFGDGQSSFLEDPTHIYYSPGDYEATITVTDANDDLLIKALNITVKDPDINVSYPIESNGNFKIANFNIQVFGISKAGKENVMNRLAEIISFFDIVSIQEIRDISETAIEDLEVKVDSLGIDYEYVLGPRLGRTSSKEQYAYMYRTDTVDVESFYTFDDSADIFHREPLIAKFKLKNGNFDFVLITIHVDPDEATEEINQLPTAIVDAQNHFPSELDFILLGDLNADCSYFDEDDVTIGLKDLKYTWLIDNTMDTNLASSECTYDRIIILDDSKEDYTGTSGVFLFDEYFGLSYDEALDISDHYPVWSEFYINNDTDLYYDNLDQTQISQLYVAIFGRASEGEGNIYWQSQSDMAIAAATMLDTQAAKDYFGANLNTNQAFIEHIYWNTLKKSIADDSEGIDYWVGMLEAGTSRGSVVAALVGVIKDYAPDGPYYDPDDAATVAAYNQFINRVEVSNYMAENVYDTPDNWEIATAFNHELVVTDDPTTVTSAKMIVDSLKNTKN
jgi:endonuclease/exonuclease/phosphatase family metal-dependent hydrolase